MNPEALAEEIAAYGGTCGHGLHEVQARQAIGELTKAGYVVVPETILSAMGSHDATGTDHMEDAARLADENDQLRKAIKVALNQLRDARDYYEDGCRMQVERAQATLREAMA